MSITGDINEGCNPRSERGCNDLARDDDYIISAVQNINWQNKRTEFLSNLSKFNN